MSVNECEVKVIQSCPTLCDPMDYTYSPRNSPGQNTGVSSLSLLQEIFPTQGLNPGLPHCRRILYQLSHKQSPRILEWVAYLFSSGSSRPRNQTWVSELQADSLPTELSGNECGLNTENRISYHFTIKQNILLWNPSTI